MRWYLSLCFNYDETYVSASSININSECFCINWRILCQYVYDVRGDPKLAPTGIMLMFAILYFGIMIDSGLFDPVISKILKFVKGDPLKIVVGTAILTIIVSLDGDGTTTYMITVSAMYPLYKRLGMNPSY